jgi:hypothetical protein
MFTWIRGKADMLMGFGAIAVLVVLVGFIGAQQIEIASLKQLVAEWTAKFNAEVAGRATDREAATREALVATENYRATETRLNDSNRKAADDYAKTLDSRDRLIAGLRAERMRLKADITRYTAASRQSSADPSAPRCADDPRVGTLGQLLGSGIDVAGRGQEVARALADQVTGLQRYINEVCLAK